MDGTQFDNMTRFLTDASSRRSVLGRISGAAWAAVAVRRPETAEARKKMRKKKPSFNEYGCVDVGKACRGKDAHCCSGICQGKKPKKGKKDKSRCVAHNVLNCQAGQDQCAGIPAQCGSSPMGLCYRTTGNASYCGVAGGCLECQTDADCVAQGGFGQDAACVVCPDCPGDLTTACFAAAP